MDELDARMLALLRDEARLSMAELGRRVGLSRTATLARVRRLEANGVIAGYHADVRADTTDAGHDARVGVVVRTADVAAYVRRLTAAFPELREAESLAGEYDLLLRFATDSAVRLDAILDRLNGWPQTVRTTTFIVLKRYVG